MEQIYHYSDYAIIFSIKYGVIRLTIDNLILRVGLKTIERF